MRALIYSQRPNTSTSHFDIIWSIYELQKEIPIDIETQQFESHLDTNDPTRILTRWERLNYEVDLGAKEYLKYILLTGIKPEENIYGTQWRVSINGKYLHKKTKRKNI